LVSKVTRRLGTFLVGASEAAATYRRVLERVALHTLSVGQSQLVRQVRGLSGLEDEMAECARQAFGIHERDILAGLLDVSSQSLAEAAIKVVLDEAERDALARGRSRVGPDDLRLDSDQVSAELLERVKMGYIAYPLPQDFNVYHKGAVTTLLCSPVGVAISGAAGWQRLNWDRKEALAAVVLLDNIDSGSEPPEA
jgi:hypothetical protein